MRVSTRIGLSAVVLAIPLGVLVTEIVSQHEGNAESMRRERAGLVVVARTIDVFDALLTLRMALASRGALTDRATGALEEARSATRALEASASDGAILEPISALRSDLDTIVLGEVAAPDLDAEDVELVDAEIDDFAALRLPGDAPAGDAGPLAAVDGALLSAVAVLRALDAGSGFAVDSDARTNALLAAGVQWLPQLASDLARLVRLRAQPGFGTSAEAGVIEGLVVDRVLPMTRDTLARADDGPDGSTTDMLARALALATRVPAFDDDERDAYEAEGRLTIVAIVEHARQALAAADDALASRLARSRTALATTLTWSGVVTLITALLAAIVLLHVMRSLARLSDASTRIAGGDRSVRLAMTSDDEIGTAARSFDRMAATIEERDRQLEAHARDLALRVAQKTAALQTVLDGVDEGVLVVMRSGELAAERSKHVEAWLGPVERGATLAAYLGGADETLADELAVGLEQLVEGVLPFEVAAAQMPSSMRRGDRSYTLVYRSLEREGELDRVLVVIHDVTEELARAESERRAQELPGLIQRALANRAAFSAFASEVDGLLADLGDAARVTGNATRGAAARMRALHTLKGTCASHGLTTLSRQAHRLETRIAESGATAGALAAAGAELMREWRATLGPLAELVAHPDAVEITRADHAAILPILHRASANDATLRALLARVTEAGLEPVRGLLEPLAAHASQLALALGKSAQLTVRTEVSHLPDRRFRPVFTSLVHLVRNAVDHGIEGPDEREAHGKSPCGTINVDVRRTLAQLLIVVEDDGRGIDWDTVADHARARGHEASEPRGDALFLDGVSSRDESDDVSGRGVGLAAVRAAARAVGGDVTVQSGPGLGTKFSVALPLGEAA